MTILHKLS